MKDLVALVADKDMEYTLKGLLTRTRALKIREIDSDILVHPQHDPACARNGVDFLSRFSGQYRHGLLMFDYEGCGQEKRFSREEIERRNNEQFAATEWGSRARAIVLKPELEVWIWSNSPHVEDVAGWKQPNRPLRHWLIERKYLEDGESKPTDPKGAFLAALREARTPKSANLYLRIAERVSLSRCRDEAFLKLLDLLQIWFPRDSEKY